MLSEKTGKERRMFRRVPSTAIAQILPAGDEYPPEHMTVETLDMSKGGILFCCDKKLDVGTRWALKILLEKSKTLNANWEIKNFEINSPVIEAVCKVVRIHGATEIGWEIAVQFESFSADLEDEIESFLNEI